MGHHYLENTDDDLADFPALKRMRDEMVAKAKKTLNKAEAKVKKAEEMSTDFLSSKQRERAKQEVAQYETGSMENAELIPIKGAITAKKAAAITSKANAVDGKTVSAWLNVIYGKIKVAAEKGDSYINDPFGGGVRMIGPGERETEQIFRILVEQDGFSIGENFKGVPSIHW